MLTVLFNYTKIRRLAISGLVFSFLLAGCSQNKKEDHPVYVQWNVNRAESMIIPRELLPGIAKDSIEPLLQIQLVNTNTPVLGEYIITEDSVVFRPLIAFTHGLTYEIYLRDRLISKTEIRSPNTSTAPEVLSIYPSVDSVPLNLLKIYIAFSKPMQEGQSVHNIAVIKNGQDTIPFIFLDLEQELWNKERTMLTLWLDPGRTKRDLQPNIKAGSPLEQGASYQLLIKKDWRDAENLPLASVYNKSFIAGYRDNLSPDPAMWTIVPPKAGSNQPLRIDLQETLDYALLKNAVLITNNKGEVLQGIFETGINETILTFTPSVSWNPGDYSVEIESRLEDLAGNNLNRLFDKDLTQPGTGVQKKIYKRSFHIQ